MNKFIGSNIFLAITAVIGAFYSYSEYKKHQFNPQIMTAIDVISATVVLSTFIIIAVLAFKTAKRNEMLFQFLQNEIEELKVNNTNNKTYQQIKQQYHNLMVDEYSNVNIPSFLESFMVTNLYDDKKTIPKELKILQANTSTPILIGVLGTFIGLVMALSQLEIGDMSQSLNLQPILNGVGTAFYTSISGVLFSVLLGISLRTYNSDQLFIQYMLKVENLLYMEGKKSSDQKVVETLVTVREEIINMRHSFNEVSTFSKEFKNASINLQAFNKDFSSNTRDMKTIFESTKDVMQLFNDRTAQFHEDFERLFNYFKQNEAQQEQLIMRQETASDELQQIFTKNKDFQQQALSQIELIEQRFMQGVEHQEHYFTETNDVLTKVSNSITTQFDKIIDSQSKLGDANLKQIEVVEKATFAMKDVLENSNFENLAESSAMFAQSTTNVQHVIEQFADTYKDMQAMLKTHYDSLDSVTEKLNQLIDSQFSITENQQGELQKVVQMITAYQEQLQQAVIRFLNNDFDYDKLRKILDEVRENMELQNQFLVQQLIALNSPMQPVMQPVIQPMPEQQPVASNNEIGR